LVASKFNTLVGAPNPAAESLKVIKTVHCRFRLLNCIFSDELAALADRSEDVDRAALDSGLVGDNRIFWKLVEERFNNGYPVGSIDGPLYTLLRQHVSGGPLPILQLPTLQEKVKANIC
jgi:hypothetical protein